MLSFKLSFKRMDILVREYDGVERDYFMISALEDESHACHPHKLVWSFRTGYGFGQIGLLSTGAGQHPVFHLHFQLLGPVTFTFANFHQLHPVHRFTRIKKASKICVKAGQSWDFVRKTAWCEASDFLTEKIRDGHFQCRNLMKPQKISTSWIFMDLHGLRCGWLFLILFLLTLALCVRRLLLFSLFLFQVIFIFFAFLSLSHYFSFSLVVPVNSQWKVPQLRFCRGDRQILDCIKRYWDCIQRCDNLFERLNPLRSVIS